MTSSSCLQVMHFMWRTYKKRGPKYPKETQYRVTKKRTTSYIYRTSCQFHSFVVIGEQQNRAFIFKCPWTSKYLNFNRECQSHPFYIHSVALCSSCNPSLWNGTTGRSSLIATLSFNSKTEQAEAASSYHGNYCCNGERGEKYILQCSHAAEQWTTHCSRKMKKQKQTF